jgi:hypothetical protein
VFLAIKTEHSSLQNKHDVIQLFIAANKKNLKEKQLTLQEKRIVHEAIKIYCLER